MNFHKNQKKIATLLNDGWRAHTGKKKGMTRTYNTGIYLISQKQNSSFQKLGMAFGQGGVYRRLLDYKVCYSLEDEFWLNYVIICPKIKVNNTAFSHILEKKILEKIGTQSAESYSNEWLLNASTKKLETFLFNTLNFNRPLWNYVLKFTKKGWIVIENTEEFKFNKAAVLNTKIINGNVTKETQEKFNIITKEEYDASEAMLNIREKPKKIKTLKMIHGFKARAKKK
jgi:hypothetical protein